MSTSSQGVRHGQILVGVRRDHCNSQDTRSKEIDIDMRQIGRLALFTTRRDDEAMTPNKIGRAVTD